MSSIRPPPPVKLFPTFVVVDMCFGSDVVFEVDINASPASDAFT